MKWTLAFVLIAAVGVLAMVFLRSPSVSPEQAVEMVKAGGQLVDVRTPSEFASGHIDGAVNIPLNTLKERMGELDSSKPVILYCRSGQRSAQAESMLKSSGFKAAHNLGGIGNWPGK